MKNKLYQKIFLILFLTVGFFALVSDARADYYAEGILQSKNILSNATVTAINSFQVTATVPTNTAVSVKFSQDRVNYYSSAGVEDEWDSCIDGTTNIDLSGLTWSGEVLFYKIKLTTTDELVTPVVGQVMVDYDGTAVPALSGDTYYQEGIVESKNILSGATVTAINSFQIIADIPLGTAVKVKFSQDGVKYYSSAGVEDEWDSCVDGTTNVDLSGLSWTQASLFYKIKFESKVDEAMTAKVTSAQVDYDGTEVPGVTGITYPNEGYMVSTDVLAGSGITLSGSDYFGYGISYLPYGTGVSAQFSQDGITWYDSAGTMWGWDTLSFGDHSTPATALSLSALNWRGATSFYYKLKIETLIDNAVTPIIAEAGLAMFSAVGGNSGTLLGEPILDLNFDEGQGATAFDASGNNNHGTLVSGATGINTTPTMMWDKNGKKNGAMEFDGTDDLVAISNFNFHVNNQFSISQYLNLKTLDTDEPLVGEWGSSQNNILLKLDNTNNDELRICVAGTLTDVCTIYGRTTDLNLTTNQWRNVQVIYDGTQSANANKLKLYVDGQKKTLTFTGTIPATIQSASTAGLSIGGNSGDYTNFLIDDLKIFSYPISEDEIKTLYNDSSAMTMGNDESRDNNGTEVTGANKDYCVPGDSAKCDKPVLELNLDERSGTVAKDSSGNGRDGTISGAVWDRGKINSGLKFDGDGDRISIDNGSDLATSTYCAWHYYAGEDMYGLVEGADTDANFDAYISGLDDVYFWADNTDGNRTMLTGGKMIENQWNQVCFVFGSGKREIYINGAKTAGDTFTAEPIRYNFIGETNSLGYLGSIDEVRIYDYARTPAQIAWDYNRGKPISHWTFDEGNGTTAHDLGEGLNHGTITGAIWKNESECKNGKCLSFDGVNDFVEKDIRLVSGYPFTMATWFKTSDVTTDENHMIFTMTDKDVVDIQYGIGVDDSEHKARIMARNSSSTYEGLSDVTVNDNQWHHLVGVFNSDTDRRLYLDGNLEATVIDSVSLNPSVDRFSIGRWGDSTSDSYFEGLIDDVKIFNYALTDEQIKLEYNNSSAVNFR
jgi:hypothetical protein